MDDSVTCKEITNEDLSLFPENKEWIESDEVIQSGRVTGFSKKLKKIDLMLERCLSKYDMEVRYFDEGIRTAERHYLAMKLQQDMSLRVLEASVRSVRAAKLSEITADYEGKLNKTLSEPVEVLLHAASNETWPTIRNLLQHETKSAVCGYSGALFGFDMDEKELNQRLAYLETYARNVVETKARAEAEVGRVLMRMKDRFMELFTRDSSSMPRVWTTNVDILALRNDACSAALRILSSMAALRLDDDCDIIEKTLSNALGDTTSITSFDLLASSEWEGVHPAKTLITPVQCISLWEHFKTETEYIVSLAIAAQKANKRNNNWQPPPWALAAMVILGLDDFVTLLRNPSYIFVSFIGFQLIKALWVQLINSGEFRNGALQVLHSLSTKFRPTIVNSFLVYQVPTNSNEPSQGMVLNTNALRQRQECIVDAEINPLGDHGWCWSCRSSKQHHCLPKKICNHTRP